jgi:hypothetical protein
MLFFSFIVMAISNKVRIISVKRHKFNLALPDL